MPRKVGKKNMGPGDYQGTFVDADDFLMEEARGYVRHDMGESRRMTEEAERFFPGVRFVEEGEEPK